MENKNDQNIEESKEINNKEDGQKDQEELSVEDRLKEAENKNLRSLAEIENQRRRYEKEIKEAFEFGGFNFAKETLSLLDNIERATDSFKNDDKLKDNKDLDKIIDGIEIVKKDLISIFKKNGIEPIECKNKKFDPNFHQAMSEIEDDKTEPGTILQELQAGYMLADRLLRPSLVSVSKKESPKDEGNKDKKEAK